MPGIDAITLLKKDHKEVKSLFRKFEKLQKSEDSEEARAVCMQILQELSIHAMIEEEIFYPFVKDNLADMRDMVFESLEEHHIVKNTVAELERMKRIDDRFNAKMTVLMEMVEHHVDEEEQELFPKVREAFGRKTLTDLGGQMQEVKESVMKLPPEKKEQPSRIVEAVQKMNDVSVSVVSS